MPPWRLNPSRWIACALAVVIAVSPVPAHAKSKDQAGAARILAVDTLRTEVLKSAGETLLGEDAPWLAGWTLEGEVWNIGRAVADTSIDRVAMVFFATWCAPCRHGIALLRERAADLAAHRVKVVLVDFAEEPEKVRAFLGDAPPFTVVLDRYGNCRKSYLREAGETVMLPQTVVVGRNGRTQLIIGKEGADFVDRIIAGH